MRKSVQFIPTPVSRAVGAFVMLMAVGAAQAGPGFGDAYDLNNNPFVIDTYFASSPAGNRLWTKVAPDGTTVMDTVTGQPVLDPLFGAPDSYDPKNRLAYAAKVKALYPAGYPGTGKALRKFVDPLPLIGAANAKTLSDGTTTKYIPLAKPAKWVNPQGKLTNDDYYEIAAVEYHEKMHSDLAGATTLRGYVQIDQEATNGRTPLVGSKSVKLFYPDGSPIMVASTDANGKLLSPKVMVQALAYDDPHFFGPAINATKGTPTRVKFLNLLPAGRAEQVIDPTTGKLTVVKTESGTGLRNGDIFLPVDQSIAGAGFGPDGIHTYSTNRVNIHLHGGDNPWISDGMPHSWITPAGELDANLTYTSGGMLGKSVNTVARALGTSNLADPLLQNFTRGSSAINVPDMNDPGPGAMTYYYPNGQNARMEWYHDHTIGTTRLNVYAGLAAPYFITDPTEQALIKAGTLPGPDATIPLILQERVFVPDDIALQDARWDTAAWGNKSDFWYPHVYETVQDPNQATNFNAVGRWHWGPWFWPSFPSAYNLPSGAYGDETLVPEAWGDTPLVNGVAYPTLTVEPKPYRLRILNASNDRSFTFNMFVADTSAGAQGVTQDPTRPVATNTEVKMVPVNSWSANVCADATATRFDPVTGCVPQTWSTDVYGHNGGVPDATTQGPTLYQIASEGGWLPGVAPKDPTPTSFLLDKGRAAVLNVDYGNSGLVLGNAERADVVVDFSAYAGKTLLVYNDSGAPVPAADPRNEYFTGYGDNSATGGAEDTRAGYGPNTRTIMQIVVAATVAPGTAVTPLDPVALDGAVKGAYKATQDTPVVAQSAYNAALGTTWDDTKAFARIYTGSLKEPAFEFVPGTAGAAFNSIIVGTPGSGYTRPPTVQVSAPDTTVAGAEKVQATANASLKIDKLYVIDGGLGFKVAPQVTITSNFKGSGAGATATLGVGGVSITNGGSGYGNGGVSTATVTSGGNYQVSQVTAIAVANANANSYAGVANGRNTVAPTITVTLTGGGGSGATAQATVAQIGRTTNYRITAITVTNPGSGYTTSTGTPPLSVAIASNGTVTTPATASATVTTKVVAPSVTFPTPAGGVAATATVVMTGSAVSSLTITNAGSGYATAPTPTFVGAAGTTAAVASTTVSALPTITFAKPLGKNPVQATGVPIVSAAGVITGVNITNPGSGYTVAPSVVVSSGTAKITALGTVAELILDQPDPTSASSSGGGGYDDLSTTASEPNNLTPGLTIGFTAPPASAVSRTPRAGATGKVFDITLTNAGKGYVSAPTITVVNSTSEPQTTNTTATNYTLLNVAKVAATAKADTSGGGTPIGKYLVKTKAIQELFDPTYGRLNATFGVEIPYTSALTQTTIPLGYIDVPTEEFQDGETQIWKITHNGVDTHPIHFHLLNVQLINRVGWDNFIQPPELNELGWKETIKMSPLEDVIVAVRAKKPNLRQSSGTLDANGNTQFAVGSGFGLPNSYRLLDPSQPEGAMTGFTQIDPNTGLPAPMANTWQDYGWEYVWHCHILGHEENDFMRPWIFHANEVKPVAPTSLTAGKTGSQVDLSWNDNSDTEFKYRVEYSTAAAVNTTTTWTTIDNTVANATQYTVNPIPVGANYYRVVAVGQNGESASNAALAADLPAAPTGLTAAARTTSPSVVLTWTDNATNETGYQIQRSLDGGLTWVTITTTAANVATYTHTANGANGATALVSSMYRVVAMGAVGNSQPSNTVTVDPIALVAPTIGTTSFVTTGPSRGVAVSFTDQSTNETRFQLLSSVNGGAFAPVTGATLNSAGAAVGAVGGAAKSITDTSVMAGNTYAYQVVAQLTTGNTVIAQSPASASTTAVTPLPAAPTNLLVGLPLRAGANDTVTISVTAPVANGSPAITGYVVQTSTNGTTGWATRTSTLSSALTTGTVTIPRGNQATPNPASVFIRVMATNAIGNGVAVTTPAAVTLR